MTILSAKGSNRTAQSEHVMAKAPRTAFKPRSPHLQTCTSSLITEEVPAWWIMVLVDRGLRMSLLLRQFGNVLKGRNTLTDVTAVAGSLLRVAMTLGM